MNTTLVIMAAGMGSRFKGGIKQLEPVGPNGELMMEYAINDAIKAGFNKVVFIIRRDLEEIVREVLIPRIENKIRYELVFQDINNIPVKIDIKRIKPWGTGHALLSIKGVVNDPFVIINADDCYGKIAYKKIHDCLVNEQKNCMVMYYLKNTLLTTGRANRGICKSENGYLKEVIETCDIENNNGIIYKEENNQKIEFKDDTMVSMNIWGFQVDILEKFEKYFVNFLNNLDENDITSEFMIPKVINEMLKKNEIKVRSFDTTDKCIGITYLEDKKIFLENIN